MKVTFCRNHQWIQGETLWEALSLENRMEAQKQKKAGKPYVIAAVGAGGKTSLLKRLALEGTARNLRVLVVTTTHMFRPKKNGLAISREEIASLSGKPSALETAVRRLLEENRLAVVGKEAENGKISFVGRELYKEICPLADLVLAEADGSKRLPLKVPGANEPVIPEHTDLILTAAGLSAIGQSAEEKCFRLEQACRLLGRCGGKWIIKPEDVACLMKKGYLEPLRAAYPQAAVVPALNQADDQERRSLAVQIFESLGESGGIASAGLREDESAGIF